MNIEIKKSVLERILKRAIEGAPDEVCGAILRGEHIVLKNVLVGEKKKKGFRLDSHQQFSIWNEWDKEGELTIYHSHPLGSSAPSFEDIETFSRAIDGMSFLIYSIKYENFRAFRKGGGVLFEVGFEVVG